MDSLNDISKSTVHKRGGCKCHVHIEPTAFIDEFSAVALASFQNQLCISTICRGTKDLGKHHQPFARYVPVDQPVRKRDGSIETQTAPTIVGGLSVFAETQDPTQLDYVSRGWRWEIPRPRKLDRPLPGQGRQRPWSQTCGCSNPGRKGRSIATTKEATSVLGGQTNASMETSSVGCLGTLCPLSEPTSLGLWPYGTRTQIHPGRS